MKNVYLNEDHILIRDMVRKFSKTEIEPFVDDFNSKMDELGDIGWDNVGLALKENIGQILKFAGEAAAISAQITGIKIIILFGQAYIIINAIPYFC